MSRIIGTAGHVDHGKTTLIKALTGIDTDRLPEEKSRGLTIDIGFAYIDLPEIGRTSVIDVPGHEKFLTNMLVGAMGMDVALLCIAADESIMPQTTEHFQILKLLPVEKMVVALTRADLVDQDMIEMVGEGVKEMLAGTRFEGSPMVAVSAHAGSGIDELKQELTSALKEGQQRSEGGWYMPIDRVFTIKGHGTVATGSMAGGSVKVGSDAVVFPGAKKARIRSIQSHDADVEQGDPGTRTALNLTGIDTDDLSRGMLVASPGTAFESDRVDLTIEWLEAPKHGQRVRVSIGANEGIGKVLLNDHDPSLVQIALERPVAVVKDQPAIVRQYSPPKLLGGGKVTVPQAARRRKSDQVEAASGADDGETLLSIVDAAGRGISTEELCQKMGKSAQALGDLFETLKGEKKLIGFAGLWFVPERFKTDSVAFLRALKAAHEEEPSVLLHARERIVHKAGLKWAGKPLDRIIAALQRQGLIRVKGTQVALEGHRAKLSDRQRKLLDVVKSKLDGAEFSPPKPREISESLRIPPQAVEEIIGVGQSAGEIVRVEEGIFYTTGALDLASKKLSEKFGQEQFAAADARELLGTSRKYIIPLLEYFDSKSITKRLGDKRILL